MREITIMAGGPMKKRILFMVVVLIFGLGCFFQGLRAQEKQATMVGSIQAPERQAARADSISLLDTASVTKYLGLSVAQQDSVRSKIAEVRKIVDEDKRIRDQIRAQFMSGQGQLNRESMQKARSEREERQKRINSLVNEIQNQLSKKQKEKFASVLVPDLQEIARAERGQWRGRGGQRRQ
jgi:hypothetical protein